MKIGLVLKIKWMLFMTLCVLKCSAQVDTSIVNSRAQQPIIDSSFQVYQTIPTKSTYFTTDNLQNVYVATEKGQVLKFDKQGNLQFEYNNNRLGQVGKIDVQNPLNILVYYPDLAAVVILDRTLSVIKELNLFDLDILSPKGIALANDNNIWVFDEVTTTLKKINADGVILFESRNLNQLIQKQLSPSFLQEKNNLVYLSDLENGLFVFDVFGQLKQTIPIKNIRYFQVVNNQVLLKKDNNVFILDLITTELQKLALPTDLSTIDIPIHLSGNLFYLATTEKILIYQSTLK